MDGHLERPGICVELCAKKVEVAGGKAKKGGGQGEKPMLPCAGAWGRCELFFFQCGHTIHTQIDLIGMALFQLDF